MHRAITRGRNPTGRIITQVHIESRTEVNGQLCRPERSEGPHEKQTSTAVAMAMRSFASLRMTEPCSRPVSFSLIFSCRRGPHLAGRRGDDATPCVAEPECQQCFQAKSLPPGDYGAISLPASVRLGFPLSCQLLRLGDLRGRHLRSDQVAVPDRAFATLFFRTRRNVRREAKPLVRLYVVQRHTLAASVHHAEIILCLGRGPALLPCRTTTPPPRGPAARHGPRHT